VRRLVAERRITYVKAGCLSVNTRRASGTVRSPRRWTAKQPTKKANKGKKAGGRKEKDNRPEAARSSRDLNDEGPGRGNCL